MELDKKKVIGTGIFLEAVVLSLINYILFKDHSRVIDFSNISLQNATNIIAILTILLLSIGFIYYIGYFLANRILYIIGFIKEQDKADFRRGNDLKGLILPYGGIFLLAISIVPLDVYLSSKPELFILRIFLIINFGFVFSYGLINELIVQYIIKPHTP